MLHSRRRRLAEQAAREAAGESFWSELFDERFRARLLHALNALDPSGEFRAFARSQILREEGLFFLNNARRGEAEDFSIYVLECPHDMVPTAIEAFAMALADYRTQSRAGTWDKASDFERMVNMLLREHRVSYELNAGEMVPFASREMHEAVISPTLRLLAGSDELFSAETAYRKALEEISKGDAADAVTDAGTALQEALTALGCQGNALGPLIKSARSKGLLAGHDTAMLDAIEKTMSWVSADRSNTGDSHNAREAEIEDAWLIVHIVGAVILRLSKKSPRHGRAELA